MPLQQFELEGVPSRARLSPDERFAAITLFVTGDDYEADFSTRTKIFELDQGRMLPDIEFFDVQRDGQPFQRIDFGTHATTPGPSRVVGPPCLQESTQETAHE